MQKTKVNKKTLKDDKIVRVNVRTKFKGSIPSKPKLG